MADHIARPIPELQALLQKVQEIAGKVLDRELERLERGEETSFSGPQAAYVVIRLQELAAGAPPPPPPRPTRDLSRLSLEELRKYRDLVAKTQAPKLDS